MKPAELSQQLRRDSGDFLEERRGIVVASMTAIGCMGLIALYQMGAKGQRGHVFILVVQQLRFV
ncbi:MAG: hypothetical protein H0W04_08785 [Chthoniobacterales bacterium]|nr:hypothetical protein [Chthoniobacterales bacterium]